MELNNMEFCSVSQKYQTKKPTKRTKSNLSYGQQSITLTQR